MRIGIPAETTPGETRVALAPHAVYELVRAGHRVLVESGAGEASAIPDSMYESSGARVVRDRARVFDESELLAKVYGPTQEEYPLLREGLILFSFLSLAIDAPLRQALLDSRCVAVASEAIRDPGGARLPVLTPMSEIAGRLVPQIGAHYLQRQSGGRGILLGGAAGVRPARVVILGSGIVGSAAARVASGLGAHVVVFDRDVESLRRLEAVLGGITTLAASSLAIRDAAAEADLLIGAVLVVGSRTPALVDREMVGGMKGGSVIVDVDVDNGGSVETSRPTTLAEPAYVECGVTHYCVKNVPAAVPLTATRALSNALLPYVRRVAGVGLADAVNADAGLGRGVTVAEGRVVDPALARAAGLEYSPLTSVLPLHAEAR